MKPHDAESTIESAIFSMRGIISVLMMLELHLEDIDENPDRVNTPTGRIMMETIGSIRDHAERVERDLTDAVNLMCKARQNAASAQPTDQV